MHPDEAPSTMRQYTAMDAAGEDVHRYLHRDGHLVLAECVATLRPRRAGPPIMTVVVVTDITRRERAAARSCATRRGTIR